MANIVGTFDIVEGLCITIEEAEETHIYDEDNGDVHDRETCDYCIQMKRAREAWARLNETALAMEKAVKAVRMIAFRYDEEMENNEDVYHISGYELGLVDEAIKAVDEYRRLY